MRWICVSFWLFLLLLLFVTIVYRMWWPTAIWIFFLKFLSCAIQKVKYQESKEIITNEKKQKRSINYWCRCFHPSIHNNWSFLLMWLLFCCFLTADADVAFAHILFVFFFGFFCAVFVTLSHIHLQCVGLGLKCLIYN